MAPMARAELIQIQEPGASSMSPTLLQDPRTWAILPYFPGHKQGAGPEVEKPGREPESIWDANTCKRGLANYSITWATQNNIAIYWIRRIYLIYLQLKNQNGQIYILFDATKKDYTRWQNSQVNITEEKRNRILSLTVLMLVLLKQTAWLIITSLRGEHV